MIFIEKQLEKGILLKNIFHCPFLTMNIIFMHGKTLHQPQAVADRKE